MGAFHLAQINIGRLLAPIDHPQIAAFVAQLDEINLLAEQSPGFVWRLKSDSGNATEIPYNDDPLMIINMSVWESIEALKAFTYQSRHTHVLKNRKSWFEKLPTPHYCLWWVPAGHIPTVTEGRDRLQHYISHGSTPESFWFSEPFPAEMLQPV
jgi:uncharacterized protein DUF3291